MKDITFCLELDGGKLFYPTIKSLLEAGWVHLSSGVDNGKAWVCLGLPDGE